MATDISVPASFHNIAIDPAFAQSKVAAGAMGEGVTASFPVLSIRGKVFRLKYRGEEKAILNPQTGQPTQTLPIIIVNASPVISKTWYEAQFVEGQGEAPDCFSINGLEPDPASAKRQAPYCATCPQNKWGSRMVNGKAAKACADVKRIAIVPAADPRNELHGGPMLLRVPPASLQDMSAYGSLLQQYSQTFFSVITELSFDFDVAHPKLKFKPVTPIQGDLARIVLELQDHPQVYRMLTEGVDYVKAEDPDLANAQPAGPPPATNQPAYTPPPPPPTPAAGMAFGAPTPAAPPAGPQNAPPAAGVAFGAPTPPAAAASPPAGSAPSALAALEAQLAEMKAALAAQQAGQAAPATPEAKPNGTKRARKASNPPPSPSPTPPPGVTDVEAAAGMSLPEGMDAELDQLLSKS